MSVWTAVQQLNHLDIAAVDRFFAPLSHSDVLKYCCNLNRAKYPNAPALAAHTVVICLDTEGWDADSERLKELGMNTFEAGDMTMLASPGPWGEEILERIYFYFARIEKNAHLINKNASKGHPDNNRFGIQRFLDDQAVIDFLTSAFEWPLNYPMVDGYVCPVVILGHALNNDIEKIEKFLSWSPRTKGNLVKLIDTQVIAREVGHWTHPSNEVGLQRLVGNMGFEHRDGHTASNDAAMTTIAAIQLVLDDIHKGPNQPCSLQDVVDNIEALSQGQGWSWGNAMYCFRCGSNSHMVEDRGDGRKCHAQVTCNWCRLNRPGTHLGHRTEVCVMQAFETSNSSRPGRRRRIRDAAAARSAGGQGGSQPALGAGFAAANNAAFPPLPAAPAFPPLPAVPHSTPPGNDAGQVPQGNLPAAAPTGGAPPQWINVPHRPRAGNQPGLVPRPTALRNPTTNHRGREHCNPFRVLDRGNNYEC